MDDDGSTGDGPRRIEVDPADVRVVATRSWSYGAPPPTSADRRPWLRRHRAKLAVGLAAAETLALAVGGVGFLRALAALLVVAALAIGVHVLLRSRIPYAVQQLTWVLALSQVLALLFPVVVIGGIIAIAIVLAVLVLAGLAILLGDRR
mgnify:CR=1 FL=1